MSFLMADKALDLRDVFLFSLDGVGINTNCKVVVATILSLSSTALGILLVILVLLVTLALMDELFTRCVSREKISGLSLSNVVLLLFSGPASLRTL